MLKIVLLLGLSLSSALGGLFNNEKCPEFKPMKNFNLTAYLGTWHEILRYPNKYELFTSCLVSDYKATGSDDKGTTMEIGMTFVRFYKSHSASLDCLYQKGDDKGEFVIMPQYEKSPNSFILKTDYKTYALEYSCEYSMIWGPVEMVNIYSRTNTLDQDIIDDLKYMLEDMGSDITKFEEPEHVNCPGSSTYDSKRPFKFVDFS